MSKLGLGTVQFGTDYGVNSVDGQVRPEEVKKILSYAYSKHIDLLDTAPAYGKSEKILGRINNLDFKVVTKTRHFDSLKITNNEVRLLNNDFKDSLNNLNQENIYGLLIHNADDLLKPGAKKIFDKLNITFGSDEIKIDGDLNLKGDLNITNDAVIHGDLRTNNIWAGGKRGTNNEFLTVGVDNVTDLLTGNVSIKLIIIRNGLIVDIKDII